jgi:hypothetical protein
MVTTKPDQKVLQALARRMGRLEPRSTPTSAPASAPAAAQPGRERARDHLRPTALGEVHREETKVVLPYLWLPESGSREQLTRYLCRMGCIKLRMAQLSQNPDLE